MLTKESLKLYDKVVINNNSSKSLKLLGFGLAEVVFFLFAIALFFGVLNYFNIISLSTLYPKYFGFLPQKQSLSQTKPNSVAKYFCPAPIRPCDGKMVFRNNSYVGIAFKLSNADPILAAISGDLIYRDKNATQSSVRDTAIIVGKTGETKGYTALYDFLGAKIGDKLTRIVLAQDKIGIATAGSYLKDPQYKGINLIFRIHNPQGSILRLVPSDFQ